MANAALPLKKIPWLNRGSRNRRRPVRTVKLVTPMCGICQPFGGPWWVDCPHDKFHHTSTSDVSTPVIETNEDGEEVVVDTLVKKLYHRSPNVRELPVSVRVSSGLEVDRWLGMGAKFPPDVDPYPPGYDGARQFSGYAPMCEFRGCYEPNPKVKIDLPQIREENPFVPHERTIAHFCCEIEAKEVTFKERGTTREVFDQKKRNKQLQEMSL